MKKLLVLVFGIFFLIGCMPVRKVNVYSRNNYYERHRFQSYTSPTWIPGYGIILETHIIPKHRYIKPKAGRTFRFRR